VKSFSPPDAVDYAIDQIVDRHFAFCADAGEPWENGRWPEWTYLPTADELVAFIDRWRAGNPDGLTEQGKRIMAGAIWEIWRRLHAETP
jgi:hypothetical protein